MLKLGNKPSFFLLFFLSVMQKQSFLFYLLYFFIQLAYTNNMKENKSPRTIEQTEQQNEPPMVAPNEKSDKNKPTMYALKNINKKWLGVFFILLSAFCYSLMSLFVRLSGDLPTFQKAFFRNLIAAIVAFALLLNSRSLKMQKGSFPALLGRTIAGTVGILCNFYAIDRMNISDASILNKLAPFFSVIFSGLLLQERASVKDWCIITLAFVGALFIVKPSFGVSDSIPALIGVVGGFGAGIAYTFVRKLGKQGERTTYIVFFFSACSCLFMLPFAIAQYQPMSATQCMWLLLAGCAASGAQFSVTAAYSCAKAREISVYDYSQVLFSALWGMLFLSQLPDGWSVVGYVIIIGAAILKTLHHSKQTPPQNEKK